ncbi:S9 family peptidase [Massilia sp. ZL223]|uniref:alpha/beta hydrolase family protein n=1 Tax=Massilia sp. ZL223 TaxID=2824904 RepID=UPI001B815644|nr:S9 family peptidase [Massilia sp. ZL223]MBQ5962438.1 S9 family peptidase [Massilia sp. ZL223]
MQARFLLSRAVLLATLALSGHAVATPAVPLEAFLHEDPVSKPRLSPDGKHIAVTVRIPDKNRYVPVVMMYAIPEMRQVGAIRMPAFEVPEDYVWVTNTRLAISKGRELGSRERPVSTGEILSVDLDGGKQEYLYGYKMYYESSRGKRYGDDQGFGSIEDIPRQRDGRIFVTSHLWEGKRSQLYEIDARSAVRTLVADVPSADLGFVIQSNGKPRYAGGIGDDAHPLLMRRDDASGRWERSGAELGTRYRPFAFSADDSALYVTQSPDGGPDRLVREEVGTGKRTVLFEDPEASFNYMQAGSRFAEPFGASGSIGRPRMRYFDDSNADAQLHKTLSGLFPDHFVSFIDFSDDGSTLLFGVLSDRDPGSYYLFNRKTMKADLLFSTWEMIDPAKMAAQRPIRFTARDGQVLHGFLTLPAKTADGAKPPLVLMPHGGPHGPFDTWFFDSDAQFLASRGYAVLQVNFRGSGGRGMNFESAGYQEWGGKIQDDLVDGVRWAAASGEVDSGKTCVYGASFGAYAAMMLAAQQPAMFKCAVGYIGVYDLSLLGKPENLRTDEVKAAYIRKVVGSDKDKVAAISPVNLAARIKAPVLLIHGGKDKRAPLEHGEAMRDALAKAGNKPEWFLAPDEGHGFYDTKNLREFYTRLETFLGKHLK